MLKMQTAAGQEFVKLSSRGLWTDNPRGELAYIERVLEGDDLSPYDRKALNRRMTRLRRHMDKVNIGVFPGQVDPPPDRVLDGQTKKHVAGLQQYLCKNLDD